MPHPRYYYRDPATGHLRYTCASFVCWVGGIERDDWQAIFRRKTAVLTIPYRQLILETRLQLPPLPTR